ASSRIFSQASGISAAESADGSVPGNRIGRRSAADPWNESVSAVGCPINYAVAPPPVDPTQKLRNTVDLIVELAIGELHHLRLEVLQPGRRKWQMHLPSFDLRRLGMHAHDLLALRLERRRPYQPIPAQFLN